MKSLVFGVICVCTAHASNFVPANDPFVTYQGRTLINNDGSRTFNWEGVQISATVQGATYVSASFGSTGSLTRMKAYLNGIQATEFFVMPANANYTVVAGLGMNSDAQVLTLFNVLEPSFQNLVGNNSAFGITFYGFSTDGTIVQPSLPKTRSIEFFGDSITVGYGSSGVGPCPAGTVSNDNSLTWDAYLCSDFNANCNIIAWSGKGMYENCCDSGPTMPTYYLQTIAGVPATGTNKWDFSQFIPDVMVINLGTNDFGHDSGAAWEQAFVNTYVEFLGNVTTQHYPSKPPVFFVAQGPMNNSDNLYNCLQQVISTATAAGMKALYLDMRNLPTDGCANHPGLQGHIQMAQKAKPQIATGMGWY